LAYHGVPAVLADSLPQGVIEAAQAAITAATAANNGTDDATDDATIDLLDVDGADVDAHVLAYLRCHRINFNVRQVVDDEHTFSYG
jgi:hypothetical protein